MDETDDEDLDVWKAFGAPSVCKIAGAHLVRGGESSLGGGGGEGMVEREKATQD